MEGSKHDSLPKDLYWLPHHLKKDSAELEKIQKRVTQGITGAITSSLNKMNWNPKVLLYPIAVTNIVSPSILESPGLWSRCLSFFRRQNGLKLAHEITLLLKTFRNISTIVKEHTVTDIIVLN